jgi:cellobiose phosphorylase
VKNPEHIHTGIQSVRLDGKDFQGVLIPAFEDGGVHNVEVILGKTP